MDVLQVLKANPYHDEKGRFTTGEKAKFVSIGDKFQGTLNRQRAALAAKEKEAKAVKFTNFEDLTHVDHRQEFEDRLQEGSKGMLDAATPEQYEALRDYTGSSYKDMNRVVLANGDLREPGAYDLDWEGKDFYADKVRHVDTFMETASATEDIIVYRAANLSRKGMPDVQGGSKPQSINESLIGKEFFDPEIGSTSIEEYRARNFMTDSRTMLEIRVRKGKKGVYMGKKSTTAYEKEFIMARKTKYKIRGIIERNGYRMLQVDAWD